MSFSYRRVLKGIFRDIWIAHTVSQVGTQVTLLALPFTAALTLNATPFQMGILTAAGTLPNLLFSLIIGVWVDNWPKRITLITADLIRAFLLFTIPVFAVLHMLSIEILVIVAFLMGIASIVFEVAMASIIPVVVGRERLMESNALLETSRSTATTVGPALGGVVVDILGPPFALLLDSLSFVCSAFFLRHIDVEKPPPSVSDTSFWELLFGGFREMQKSPLLAALARTATIWNLSSAINNAVLILYVTRELHLSAAQFGIMTTMLGIGMVLGSTIVGWIQQRFVLGSVFMASGLVATFASIGVITALLLPETLRFIYLVIIEGICGIGYSIFVIGIGSFRQAATRDAVQGKVTASFRFLMMGGMPIGALIGGSIGARFGLLPALVVGTCGLFVAWGMLWVSTVPTMKRIPEPVE
ncbi:MAG: MFS transporter [Candidatus Promineifilaceae bacterium]